MLKIPGTGLRPILIASLFVATMALPSWLASTPALAQDSPADICLGSLDRAAGEDGQRVAEACLTELRQGSTSAPMGYAFARTLHAMGHYDRSIEIYTMLANGGFAPAQSALSAIYVNGDGVAANYALAAEWTRKLAEQGDAGGQNNLGLFYRAGAGVEKNDAEALRWFMAASAQGHEGGRKNALALLEEYQAVAAEMHDESRQRLDNLAARQVMLQAQIAGLEAIEAGDYELAASLLSAPAEAGDVVSQYYLGTIYVVGGKGLTPDMDQGVKWLTLAADQGHGDARITLEKVPALVAAEQELQESQERVRIATENAAAIQEGAEALRVGNYKRALELLLPREALLTPLGHFEIARIYLLPAGTVPGVEPNRDEAIRHLRVASDQDYEPAASLLRQLGVQ